MELEINKRKNGGFRKGRGIMVSTTDQIIPIKLSKIQVSDSNVRKEGAVQELDELAASIKAVGLLQPVLVMKNPQEDKYDLIVGQRRYLAHKRLGRTTIRAVDIGRLSKDDALIRSLVENVHRVELNHADAAKATTALYKRHNRNVREVSRITGLSPQRIRQYVYIQELASDATKEKLRRRKVKPADVQRTIRAAKGKIEKADKLLELMKKYELDKHQKARLIEYGEGYPQWSANRIVREAMKARVETSVIVPLAPKIRKGLQKAVDSLRREPHEITAQALEHWLRRNGYF